MFLVPQLDSWNHTGFIVFSEKTWQRGKKTRTEKEADPGERQKKLTPRPGTSWSGLL
jgi:hypothetical protein